MSNQAATDFLQQLVQDEALREQVRQAEKGRSEKAPVLVQEALVAARQYVSTYAL